MELLIKDVKIFNKKTYVIRYCYFWSSNRYFFLSHVIPADPVGAILGENAPQELVEKMERELGLDLPLDQQYIRYLKGIINWDFGMSLRTQRPVSKDMRIYFPATMELAFFALLLQSS